MKHEQYLINYDDMYETVYYTEVNEKNCAAAVKSRGIKLIDTGNGYEFSWEDKTVFLDYDIAGQLEDALYIMHQESPNPANRVPVNFFKLASKR